MHTNSTIRTQQRLASAARLLFVSLAVIFGCLANARGAESELWVYLQHGYGAVPVVIAGDNQETIQARINGNPITLMVDTGAGCTCLTSYWAQSLNLHLVPTNHPAIGVDGTPGNFSQAVVSSFKIDNCEINRLKAIQVLPPDSRLGSDRSGPGGLFGFDNLLFNAAILPVGAEYFFFKPGNTPTVPIDAYMQRLGLKAIPMHAVDGAWRIEGSLNGKPLGAMIDCGASYSTFDFDYLHAIPGMTPSHSSIASSGINGTDQMTYIFTPGRLNLGSLPIKPTLFSATKGLTVGFGNGSFNALIGYDLLASHNAIVDFGHSTLWMKEDPAPDP